MRRIADLHHVPATSGLVMRVTLYVEADCIHRYAVLLYWLRYDL
jgi:hypothetical protein